MSVCKTCDRHHTTVCIFDPNRPRITAYHIHELLHCALRLQEDDIRMIQIDGPHRRVYVKFVNNDRMMAVLLMTIGQLEYHHENGAPSLVEVLVAGLGMKRVRIAKLTLEIPDGTIRDILAKNGEVKRITEEQWSRMYRHSVYNGIRLAEIALQTGPGIWTKEYDMYRNTYWQECGI